MKTYAETIADDLRRRIVSGEIKDGAFVRQDALAEEFGVSRIPVREALYRLEGEGLVVNHPHRGAAVTALSRKEMNELFELRALLEPELIARAIPNLSQEILMEAESILREYEESMDNRTVFSLGDLNSRYHMALYKAADRNNMAEIVRGLLVKTDRYTQMVLSVSEEMTEWKREHSEILEFCRRGAVAQAVTVTVTHINRARDILAEYLQN